MNTKENLTNEFYTMMDKTRWTKLAGLINTTIFDRIHRIAKEKGYDDILSMKLEKDTNVGKNVIVITIKDYPRNTKPVQYPNTMNRSTKKRLEKERKQREREPRLDYHFSIFYIPEPAEHNKYGPAHNKSGTGKKVAICSYRMRRNTRKKYMKITLKKHHQPTSGYTPTPKEELFHRHASEVMKASLNEILEELQTIHVPPLQPVGAVGSGLGACEA